MANAPFYRIINGKWKPLPVDDKPTGITDHKLKDGYIGEFSSLRLPQLEELLGRQEKILSNRALICKLKDKGKQARERKEEILTEIEKRKKEQTQAVSKTEWSPEFVPPKDIHSIEWTGEFKETNNVTNDLDSDDDEEELHDPLQLMAMHSQDTPAYTKKVARRECVSDSDPCAAIQEELERLDLQDTSRQGVLPEGNKNNKIDFSRKNIEKLENISRNSSKREPFKPFRNTKKTHIERTKERNPQLWQESSATGPLGGDTSRTAIVIPLRESIQLLEQYQMNEKRKLIQDTASKLSQADKMDIGLPYSDVLRYRDTNCNRHVLDDDSSSDEEDREQ
ncbi:RNA polymerase II subunit M [Oratosquilla oratoria]|uniref:RNA polymerase II subunit M n=1 Tax=Oratosquilla oratoria TaxID=337810 RepID=UPI003F7753E3